MKKKTNKFKIKIENWRYNNILKRESCMKLS